MAQLGYKGIAAISNENYVLNDDGDHVIRLMTIEKNRYFVKTIAGQEGVGGHDDNAVGTSGTITKPGRLTTDPGHKVCYFSEVGTSIIRKVSLEEPYPLSTLPFTLTGGTEFKRLLVTPDGDTLLAFDRSNGKVFVISGMISASYNVQAIDLSISETKPLQASAWPILNVFDDPVWDKNVTKYSGPALTDAAFEKGLPVDISSCFIGIGLIIYKMDITNGNCVKVIDMGKHSSKFQCHEIIPVSSNTILLLNRNSIGSGVWQCTTTDNWSTSNASLKVNHILDDWFVSNHGCAISPDRKSLVILETGQGKVHKGSKRGLINHAHIRFSSSSCGAPTVNVLSTQRLNSVENAGKVSDTVLVQTQRDSYSFLAQGCCQCACYSFWYKLFCGYCDTCSPCCPCNVQKHED